MRTNAIFDTYRRETSSGKRQYDTDKTITNGVGYIEPLDGTLKAVLGLDYAVKAYSLLSKEGDFEKYDKLTITFPSGYAGTYYIEVVEKILINDLSHNKILLKQDV